MKSLPAPIVDVTAENVDELGFFCYMSKKKSPGYKLKLTWLKARFAEGLRLKMLGQGQRGFIEYIPGEFAWRPVHAEGYMVIHCLWVVGQSKSKGYGNLLLNACIEDARASGMKGVAMVTSEGNWLMGKKLLEPAGFVSVDQAPPSFNLMVKKFGKAADPRFTGDWEKKQARCGEGLTVFRSGQCPYIEDAVTTMMEAADEHGINTRVVELTSAKQVRELSPYAYGVFGTVCNAKPFSYHYLLKKDAVAKMQEIENGE